MNPRHWLFVSTAGLTLLLAGCGEKPAGPEAEAEESSGVTYKEGRGLQLAPEVVQALRLQTATAEERPLAAESALTAQVFATQPQLLATARLTADQAAPLRTASFTGARLLRIDASPAAATRLVDAVFALDEAPGRRIGDFVTLTARRDSVPTLTVPRAAILDGATGPFVYVVNGDAYLRTPVKLGAQTADFTEITDGLYAGDLVVVAPVDQLWLAELRLTKGGGHSH
ncbi:MAG: hypothetical protein JSS11_05065 [Verrucomicrobia bacterium]|nr:hypothetical protein [Verrucomicrobiota bacterium]